MTLDLSRSGASPGVRSREDLAIAERGRLAWRNRAGSAVLVVASLLALRLAFPEADHRSRATYLFVLTLGYAHLIGPVVFARGAMRQWIPSGVPTALGTTLAATMLLTVFCGYVIALETWPPLVFPMLGLATWHAFENDVALEHAYAHGRRMGPLPRRRDSHFLAAGFALLFVALFSASVSPAGQRAIAVSAYGAGWDFRIVGFLARVGAAAAGLVLLARPGRRTAGGLLVGGAVLAPSRLTPWVTFADVFALSTLYHIYSWLILSGEKLVEGSRHSPAEARRRAGLLLAVHGLPLALSGLLLAGALPVEGWLTVLVFSPGAYLFWSVAHTAQTLALRGVETAPRPGGAPSRG